MMMKRQGLRRHLLAGAGALLLLAACESKEEQAVRFAESGQEYLAQGDLDKAELQFNNALFKDPINIVALRGAAEVAEQKEQISRQGAMLQRLLNELPEDVEANLAFARIALLGGQAERALEHAERVLAQRPDEPEALTIKGAALVVEEKLSEATEVLNRALEQDPDNAEIFNLLAAGDIRRDDYEAALARVNEGIEKAENPETLLIVKLILAERLRGPDEVIETFEALIEEAPENGLYRQRLADYVLQKKRDFDRARELYVESLPYVTEPLPVFTRIVAIDRARGGNELAEKTLRGFIAENAENEDLRFAMPSFYCQTQQIEKCRGAFEELITDESLSAEARQDAKVGLADVALAMRQVDEAEKLTDEILAEEETHVGALANKGQILLARDQGAEAIQVLREALNNEPDNAEALVFLALAYEATGETQFANAQFAQAIDVVGYTDQITKQYRSFLKRQGDAERAAEVLERYIDENPADLEAVIEKAKEDVARQEYRDALRAAERLAQAGYNTEETRRLTLAALVGLERWEQALPLAVSLSEELPDDSNLAALRARILSQQDRGDEGLALLRERIEREQATTADYALLSEALIRGGSAAEAVTVSANAVERFPADEDA
jgi:tetratricopeptide (TPR) repeat protein